MQARGYEIIDRNWRTRRVEIDIVAQKQGRLHFVEVRYRRSAGYGDGLASITPVKLRQLRLAASTWLQQHSGYWRGYQIDAAAVTGQPSEHTVTYITNVVQAG